MHNPNIRLTFVETKTQRTMKTTMKLFAIALILGIISSCATTYSNGVHYDNCHKHQNRNK